jgi:hypothetical protein
MSCGNRFQCALKKSTRISFQPDKPSNHELHNENQKRLTDLLKAREEQDKMYTPNFTTSNVETNNSFLTVSHLNESDSNYTPWKTPSTTNPS